MQVQLGNVTFANKTSLLVNLTKYIFSIKPKSISIFFAITVIKKAHRDIWNALNTRMEYQKKFVKIESKWNNPEYNRPWKTNLTILDKPKRR